VLTVHHEEALLGLEESDVHAARRGEDVGSGRGLEGGDGRHDDRIYPRVDDGTTGGHGIGGRPRRRGRDNAIRADVLDDRVVHADLEVADLRDVRRVDDCFVRAIEQPLAIHGHLKAQSLLHLVVPAGDPIEVRGRFLGVDLREEAQGSRVDAEDHRVGELKGP